MKACDPHLLNLSNMTLEIGRKIRNIRTIFYLFCLTCINLCKAGIKHAISGLLVTGFLFIP